VPVAPTLNYAIASDVDSLDPQWAYDETSLFVIEQAYDGLVDFEGASLDIIAPRLASVVPTLENGFLSKDGRTYAFPLRNGVKFHDGTEMTAEDVKYSLMRLMLTTSDGGPAQLLLVPLTGRRSALGPDGRPDPEVFDLADKAVSVEGGAIVLRLPQPFAPMLTVLATTSYVVSKKFVTAHGGWDGSKETWVGHWNPRRERTALYDRENGTGPFKLTRWDHALKILTFTRNDSYWRAAASLGGLAIITLDDPKTRRLALEHGEIDVAQVGARALPYFAAVPGAQLETDLPLLQSDAIFFNQKIETRDNPWIGSGKLDGQGVPPDFFADADVRRGFASAFDTDAYIRDGFHGAAVRARGPFPPGVLTGRLPAPQWRPFSPAEAERSLRAARDGAVWANGFLLPMAYPEGDSERRIACLTLKNGLEKLNAKFRVDCRGLEQSRLLADLGKHRLSAFVYRWVLDYPDPHSAIEPLIGSQGYFGTALGISIPRADALIEQAAAETDPAKRKAEYLDLESLTSYEAPMIFTVQFTGAIARRAIIQNWVHSPIQPYGNLYEVTKLR
jgi:peptide/nickel transport system substrate-binding protein